MSRPTNRLLFALLLALATAPASDGQPALWMDITPGPQSTSVFNPAPFTDAIYFWADDGVHGREPWRTDGTLEGTRMVHDIGSGTESGFLSRFAEYQGDAYFWASTNGRQTSSTRIWKADGAGGEASLFSYLTVASSMTYMEPFLVHTDGLMYFMATSGGTPDPQIWRTDGTQQGTEQVSTLPSRSGGTADPRALVSYDGNVYFTAYQVDSGQFNRELWRLDVSTGQAEIVKDISTPSYSSRVSRLTVASGLLYFSAKENTGYERLWVTDGTTVGTRMVKRTAPLRFDDDVCDYIVPFGDELVFYSLSSEHGCEPWITDGTDEGTRLLRDVNPGAAHSVGYVFSEWAAFGGYMYFYARDEQHGLELWRTDGTEAGTALFLDLNPGPTDGANRSFSPTVVGDELYFSARDESHGYELWRTDGTPTGTEIMADLVPGFGSSYPQIAGVLDEALYFTADDEVHGRELWRVTAGSPPSPVPTEPAATPDGLTLAVGPNPASGAARVTLSTPIPTDAKVSVFDALGRRVVVLHSGPLAAGEHRMTWSGEAPAGVYVVRAASGDAVVTQRLTLVR